MKTHVNLLPLKHRRVVLAKGLLLRWGAAWVAAIAIVAGMFWMNATCCSHAEADVSSKEALCEPILATAQANKQMRTQVHRFEHRETLVGQLREDKPVLNLLAVVSNSARQSAGRITIRDLQFQQNAVTVSGGKRADRAASVEPEAVLTIEGEALDNLAIAQFAAGLRDAALFRDVDLKSSVEKTSLERHVHSFIVRCEI